MQAEIATTIANSLERQLKAFNFLERHDNVTTDIAAVVKNSWNPFRRLLGGHALAAVVIVPDSVNDEAALKSFFQSIRSELNKRFVGFAAYKSSHSFIVLVCPHKLFAACPAVASKLKDRTGLHMNLIQGVILVDCETKEVTGDYTRPAQHNREYEAVLAAATEAVK